MRLRTGIGRLTANTLNGLLRSHDITTGMPAIQAPGVPRAYGPITCRIVESNVPTAGIRRFKYVVKEVTISDAVNGVTSIDVPNGFEFNAVWNLAEACNDADYSSGIYREGLPGTFKLQPIKDDAVVAVYVNSTASGNVWAWFDRAGEFDGECTDPLTDGEDGGGGNLTFGTVFIQNGVVSTPPGGVEANILADESTTVLNSWVFKRFMYRDISKNGTWTDDGLGLLMDCQNPSTNFADWVATFPTASGTFVITQAGTNNEIFRLNYTGSGQFTTNLQRYGNSGVDYEGTVPTTGTRVDVYYS